MFSRHKYYFTKFSFFKVKYNKISQFYNLRKESIFISKNSNFKAFTLEIGLSLEIKFHT